MALDHYFEALDRLAKGKPERLKGGYRINKDTVALEAGRKRGSIKKSRPSHRKLIDLIEQKADEQDRKESTSTRSVAKLRNSVATYKELYHAALNREAMYLHQIAKLEKEQSKP